MPGPYGAKVLARDVASFLDGHGSVLGYPEAVIERVNLVDEFVVASGGQLVGRWPVDARSRNS
ncbi:MAG: hypothetical protein ABI553_06215 [Chloroflexota bacterium]